MGITVWHNSPWNPRRLRRWNAGWLDLFERLGPVALVPTFWPNNILICRWILTQLVKAGSRLGTALAMAVDNEINMVSLTLNLEKFFARESCGWCTPCREGLPGAWSSAGARKGEGQRGDIETLEQLQSPTGARENLLCSCAWCRRTTAKCDQIFQIWIWSGYHHRTYVWQRRSQTGIQPNLLNQRWWLPVRWVARRTYRKGSNVAMATIHVDGKEYEVNGSDNLLEGLSVSGVRCTVFLLAPYVGQCGCLPTMRSKTIFQARMTNAGVWWCHVWHQPVMAPISRLKTKKRSNFGRVVNEWMMMNIRTTAGVWRRRRLSSAGYDRHDRTQHPSLPFHQTHAWKSGSRPVYFAWNEPLYRLLPLRALLQRLRWRPGSGCLWYTTMSILAA